MEQEVDSHQETENSSAETEATPQLEEAEEEARPHSQSEDAKPTLQSAAENEAGQYRHRIDAVETNSSQLN